MQEVEALQKKYSKEARDLNSEIKNILMKPKLLLMLSYLKSGSSKNRAEKEIRENREQLVRIKTQLKNDIDADLPQIRSIIVRQLLSKEMS